MVVWVGYPDGAYSDGEIFLYDGASTIRLTENAFDDSDPQINDAGHVAWQAFDGQDWEIFLYDGTAVTRITNNDFTDINPRIDAAGHVVWRAYYDHWCGQNDIYRDDGSSVSTINDLGQCNGDPVVNRLGHAVWSQVGCFRWGVVCMLYGGQDLYFYDGASTSNLTNTPDRGEFRPHLNDHDEVVWTESAIGPGGNGNQEIFLHDGSAVTRLSYNDDHDWYPRINNNGYVVWSGPGGPGGEIYLYDGLSTVRLTDDSHEDASPQLNNSNQIVWERSFFDGGHQSNSEIFIYQASSATRLTDDALPDGSAQINDHGVIVWNKDWEIYLASPAQQRSVDVDAPTAGEALQDGVVLAAAFSGFPAPPDVYMFVREPDEPYGVPVGFEDLPAAFNAVSGRYEYPLDTTGLPDGDYIVFAKAVDAGGGATLSEAVPFSVRNWALVELLPATTQSQAGRTMPIMFAIRIAEAVDPAQPFVRNEDLEVRIYASGDPDNLLQVSRFGLTSVDYRIDALAGHYITNFKTGKEPTAYVVEVWRPAGSFMVGSFAFATVK